MADGSSFASIAALRLGLIERRYSCFIEPLGCSVPSTTSDSCCQTGQGRASSTTPMTLRKMPIITAEAIDPELVELAVAAARRGAGGITRIATSDYFTFEVEGDEIILTESVRKAVEERLGARLVEHVFPQYLAEVALVPSDAVPKTSPAPRRWR